MFLESRNTHGSIEVIMGSMFSGKTEELIRRLRRAKIAGLKTEIFKPAADTRYSITDVVSHDKNAISCTIIKSSVEILKKCDDAVVVGIDEAQFLDNELPRICNILADKGIRVIIAGLDMDFLGRPFGPMSAIACVADDVTKVHAICTRCGNPAHFSHRLGSNDNLIELGEKDYYEPLCRKCYNLMKARDEKPSTKKNLFNESEILN